MGVLIRLNINSPCSPTTWSQSEWENIVSSSSQATFFHTYSWNAFLEEYGRATSLFKPIHLVARDVSGELVGILPLYLTSRMEAQSLPCGDYGGPLAEDTEAGKDSIPGLIAASGRISHTGIRKAVVHGLLGGLRECYASLGWSTRETHRTYILDIAGKDFAAVESGFRRDARRALRKARGTATVQELGGNSTWVSPYYALYSETMRRLGSSPRPIVFFELMDGLIHRLGKDGAYARMAYVGDEPVAGLISFIHDGTMHIFSNVSTHEAATGHINDVLYAETIRYAVETRISRVDFGLSPLDPQSGLCIFKEKWGTRSESLYSATMKGRTPDFRNLFRRLGRLGSFAH